MTAPEDLLESLLGAGTPDDRAIKWAAFLEHCSPALLHAARAMGGGHDLVMDRYTFIIDALERDDFRRLRCYLTEGRGALTTWLLVVARRLCFDHHRHRYGRAQANGDAAVARRSARRQLTDLLGSELGLAKLEGSDARPDEQVQRAERDSALTEALRRLDPADRLLLRLRFAEDLSAGEIARVLDRSSPFVIYRRIDKLLVSLRAELMEKGVSDSVP